MYARDTARIATPVGVITISGDDHELHAITLGGEGEIVAGTAAPVRAAAEQLTAWFAGALTTFDLALSAAASERGAALRSAMVAIPYGDTLSYGALAKVAASSARAIGQACARNPFPIVVPCHRVLAAGDKPGGFSASGGVRTKLRLLLIEGAMRGTPGLFD